MVKALTIREILKANFMSGRNSRGQIFLEASYSRFPDFIFEVEGVCRLCQSYSEEKRKEIAQTKKRRAIEKLFLILRNEPAEVRGFFKGHRLSPSVELFFNVIEKRCTSEDLIYFSIVEKSLSHLPRKALNILIKIFREFVCKLESSSFKKEVRNMNRAAAKNFNSGVANLENMFLRHARLLVVRLDFHYSSQATKVKDGIDASMVKRHKEMLIKNGFEKMKRSRELVGYIWKIECTPIRGPHIHTLLFFDGNKKKNVLHESENLKKTWVEVTEGSGYVYCVPPKDGNFYPVKCIGMVKYNEQEKLEALKHIIGYITKGDMHARLIFPGRIFGQSEKASIKKETKGRPRKKSKDL